MTMAKKKKSKQRPPQEQEQQPGIESEMEPQPESESAEYRGSGKLKGKVALVTGGDSGIGRAATVAFAKEGADVAVVYYSEQADARATKRLAEATGQRCILIKGDVGDEKFCNRAIKRTVDKLGGLDILVSNAAEQHPQESITAISAEQLERTFRTNVFGAFYLIKAAMSHLSEGSSIIITTSVTAYRGSPHLIDYASTKSALVGLIRSLAGAVVDDGIRVNGVAPGPIWTPLIPASFDADEVATFGSDVPMGRAGQPDELAAAYVFLAGADSSYMTGQVLHLNGGEIING